MITINQVTHNFGKKVLFNGINTVINAHDRIALVGSNGSGKTTLLRMLMGELEPDGGSIDKAGYVSVGYLPQDGISVSGKSLFAEAESAFGDILQLQKNLEKAEEEMLEMDTSADEYYDLIDLMGEWEQQLEDHEPAKMKSRIERILLGMGFKRVISSATLASSPAVGRCVSPWPSSYYRPLPSSSSTNRPITCTSSHSIGSSNISNIIKAHSL